MKKTKRSSRTGLRNTPAFTLFELLVSISIIGILMAVVIVAFGPAQKSARDKRRQSDLEKIRMALEMYKMEKGSYPDSYPTLMPNYLLTWPVGPKGSEDVYCYKPVGGDTGPYFKYEMYANLEISDPGTLVCSDKNYNYSVTNQ